MTTTYTSRADLPAPRLEEVADGVFAYLRLPGTWGLNNAGLVAGAGATLLVDTGMTEARGRALRDAVVARTGTAPHTVVNTHHHGDHVYANWLFREATIVGHERCRAEMLATGLATTAMFPDVDFGDIEVVPPSLTFTDRLDLYVGDILVEAHHLGLPAHTTNDVVLYLPDQRVLFAGDLAFNGGTPFVLMGSVAGSLETYERLRDFDVEIVVPGHGAVCGPEVFEEAAAYLEFVQTRAREGMDAGMSPLETATDTDLGEFADLHDPERLVGNLHRAYSELGGAPLDASLDNAAIVLEMVEYNGGEPPRCLA